MEWQAHYHMSYLDDHKGIAEEVELGRSFEVADGEPALRDHRQGHFIAGHDEATPIKVDGRL